MGRLVFLTQAYLPESTILGVTQDWVRALAARCDGVDVIAQAARAGRQDGDRVRVFSLGKDRELGRGRQLVALFAALARTLPTASGVMVHMVPRYALIAAPAARMLSRPVALWYAQGGVSRALRTATRLVDHVLTPTRDSFPLHGPHVERRLRITGHGIDTVRYAPDAPGTSSGRRGLILGAGRLSASKRYDRLIEALPALRSTAWRVEIASGSHYATDAAHEHALRDRVAELGLASSVSFLGAVPYAAMPQAYRRAWLLAHTSATGSLDKVVLEAMACGVPVVSTSAPARPLLAPVDTALAPPDGDPCALAAALDEVLGWSDVRRAECGAQLRETVQRDHSLQGWAGQVGALLCAPARV